MFYRQRQNVTVSNDDNIVIDHCDYVFTASLNRVRVGSRSNWLVFPDQSYTGGCATLIKNLIR